MTKDEAARLALAPLPPSPPQRKRVIYHRGQPLLVSGKRDLPPGVLDHAVDFYAAKDRGDGPAAQMMRFVEPLLQGTGDDKVQRAKAFKLGMVFWNLALCESDQREETLAELLRTMADEQTAKEFQALASEMVARHRMMFPAFHT